MKLELKVYNCLCALSKFTINNIDADHDDFGEKYDHNPENALEDYACGNMRFNSKPYTQEVLEKYKITVNEYNKICNELEEKLSFGSCSWCV